MNIEKIYTKYLNESFSSFAKKYENELDPTKDLLMVSGLGLTRKWGKNKLYEYLDSQMRNFNLAGYEIPDGMDGLVEMKFDEVKNQFDVDKLNRAIYKYEELRKPNSLNKLEDVQFKKYNKWSNKLVKDILSDFENILEKYKVNVSKVDIYKNNVSDKKMHSVFDELMSKVMGKKFKSRKSSWRY